MFGLLSERIVDQAHEVLFLGQHGPAMGADDQTPLGQFIEIFADSHFGDIQLAREVYDIDRVVFLQQAHDLVLPLGSLHGPPSFCRSIAVYR
ncbi:hypothetical protein SDC9_198211 [bioreactor metagenome]|uniref:Uncharacterized protein n=1 Tax=bioreactor metagenome TaxID=1076179 RepID=A0A645IHI8_9ZZZZ